MFNRSDVIAHYEKLGVYIGEFNKSISFDIDLHNCKLIQEADHFLGVWMGIYNTKRMENYSFFMKDVKDGSN